VCSPSQHLTLVFIILVSLLAFLCF
jgi:hypothetical protein